MVMLVLKAAILASSCACGGELLAWLMWKVVTLLKFYRPLVMFRCIARGEA